MFRIRSFASTLLTTDRAPRVLWAEIITEKAPTLDK